MHVNRENRRPKGEKAWFDRQMPVHAGNFDEMLYNQPRPASIWRGVFQFLPGVEWPSFQKRF